MALPGTTAAGWCSALWEQKNDIIFRFNKKQLMSKYTRLCVLSGHVDHLETFDVCISRFIGLIKEFCYYCQSGLRFDLIICCSRCFGSSIWAGWRCGTQIWFLGRAVQWSATASSSCSSAERWTAAGRGWDGFLSELFHLIPVINSHVSLVLTLRDRRCCWSCRTSLSPSSTPLTTPSCTLSQSAASACGEWGGASAG